MWLLSLIGCSHQPQGVPVGAMRIGGADGAVYVELKQLEGKIQATVFADGTGDKLFDGELKPSAGTTLPPRLNEANAYIGWDGESLHLANGGQLKALKR